MTTLTTKTQYIVTWTGILDNGHVMINPTQALCESEEAINAYLDEKVQQGWTILTVSVKEFN